MTETAYPSRAAGRPEPSGRDVPRRRDRPSPQRQHPHRAAAPQPQPASGVLPSHPATRHPSALTITNVISRQSQRGAAERREWSSHPWQIRCNRCADRRRKDAGQSHARRGDTGPTRTSTSGTSPACADARLAAIPEVRTVGPFAELCGLRRSARRVVHRRLVDPVPPARGGDRPLGGP